MPRGKNKVCIAGVSYHNVKDQRCELSVLGYLHSSYRGLDLGYKENDERYSLSIGRCYQEKKAVERTGATYG